MQERSRLVMLLAMLAAACGSDRDTSSARAPGVAPQTDATVDIDSQHLPPPPASLPQRPATMRETIMVDGTPHGSRFDLVRAPPGFVVPFSTYVPEGLGVEFDTGVASHRVTFHGQHGGTVLVDAFMTVVIHPAGTTRLEVEDAVRELVVSRAPGIDESSAVPSPAWAEWAVEIGYPRSAGEWFAGTAVIAQYGPRFFHVIELFPAERGDVISALLMAVLKHWRWDDTGRMLTSVQASAR